MPAASLRASAKPEVAVTGPEHSARVIATIVRAFAADPPSRWLFPGHADYQRHFPTFARALGGAALAHGSAYSIDDAAGVALWLPPDVGPDEAALGHLVEHHVAPAKQETMAAVVEAMGRYHPETPHWYLPFIAVDPARQGEGLGAALLRATLARCDADGLPAYLESTNPRNRPLYERHGFEAIGEIRAGDCPPIVPMLHRPR